MMAAEFSSFQRRFEHHWGTLHDPHVRALAWLLAAPDLLDATHDRWEGRLASLNIQPGSADADWLHELDQHPEELNNFLDVTAFTRLGRYAEKLLVWYFRHAGQLRTHGLQVRDPVEGTLGEFDFLLRLPQGLEHWELATKFYLLRPPQVSTSETSAADLQSDYFIGPNLADTLGAKMQKIFGRQLALGQHPAAQAQLGEPLHAARALIKGWLFYRRDAQPNAPSLGVSSQHCRGWWCRFDELDTHLAETSAPLMRLSWLAPAQLAEHDVLDADAMRASLQQKFATSDMPVMVANLAKHGQYWCETDRGFVVPGDWEERAAHRPLSIR